jgi:hypothetical protein
MKEVGNLDANLADYFELFFIIVQVVSLLEAN